jgi:transposase, IS30 family
MDPRRGPHGSVTLADQAELLRRVRAGETHKAAAATVGCSSRTVARLLVKTGGIKARVTRRAPRQLSRAEREEISRGLRANETSRSIAARLGRAPSTVSRDVAGNGGRSRYRAWRADARAVRQAQRPKTAKLVRVPRLRQEWSAGSRRGGRPSRSPRASSSTIRTMARCECRTRRSTNRSSCRPGAHYASS